ncbi:thioredoxin family protein [Sphingobacterium sp. lm-10]|uniref:thioredoxin family protein n=1 Tax=Sphingobacterium sp. lm-10 TaxID=2944904 RepID=UPI0020223CB1|nr:thioredoxin family protein [Sphingobacterium sp. lm-10]MCL7989473.1 thioredoxin family protein [Sphingobacterium sp. lm-10]
MKTRFYCWIFLFCSFLPAPYTMAQEGLKIHWLSFEELADSLAKEPKKTLIFFQADWCVYCKKMEREVFTNPAVITRINQYYYAVQLDVETTDSIFFDGQLFTNKSVKKRRGQYHDLAVLLGARNEQLVLPTTLILDKNFFLEQRHFEYLHSKKLLQLLKP